jgi:hypothetical protein
MRNAPWLLLPLLSIGVIAHAMSMRTKYTPLAFSEDGRSVLVRADIQGPEGGGARDYEIWSAAEPHRQRVSVSSDLGTGSGGKTQHVTEGTCAQGLKDLDGSLKKLGFKGVAVHADRCARRSELVTVDEKAGKDLEAGHFRAKGNKLVHEGLEVRFRSTEIGLYRDETKLCTLTQPKRDAPAEIAVGGGKGNRLVYVIETTSSGDQGLLGMCGESSDGKLAALPLGGR